MVITAYRACAFGQQPAAGPPADAIEKDIVSRLLATKEASQVAWGAYLAANYQQKGAIPAIIPLLRSSDTSVQLAAIDALIRLNADVPEEDLSTFLTTNQLDPVLVLLAQDPKKHGDFLLQLLDRDLNDTAWIAVNSILWMAPPSGFAARLLRDWRLHFSVQITDAYGLGVDGGCGTYSGKGPTAKEGFPPQFFYVIQESMSSGDTLLASGPYPVSYRRKEQGERRGGCISRDVHRMNYLKSLARISSDSKAAQLPSLSAEFHWVDAAKYQSDAEALLISIRTAVSFIRDALINRGLLAPEEAAVGPKFEVVVSDLRQNHHDPFPVIDWRLDNKKGGPARVRPKFFRRRS